jgi:hypothetical protein
MMSKTNCFSGLLRHEWLICRGELLLLLMIFYGQWHSFSGAGTLMTMSFLVLTDLVSLRERGKWVGIMSLVWLVGSVARPIIRGVFS